MEYKIKRAQFRPFRYGFCNAGTIAVDSGKVRLSGWKIQGLLLLVLVFPGASILNTIVGFWLGVQLKILPLFILCAAVLFVICYKRKTWFDASVSVEKGLITGVSRDGENISFGLPDPEGQGGSPAEIWVKTKNEAEAIKLENELRA